MVAGGDGRRFGGPKQFAELCGRPLAAWSLAAARATCSGVVLVVPPDVDGGTGWEVDSVVVGGRTRSASVRAGLAAVPASAEVVVVHDAARPLARVELWRAVLAAIRGGADAAIPAVAVTDTIKRVGARGELATLDRSALVAVQTPQAFRADVLRSAHASGDDATDDAALVEAAGARVELVPGAPDNLKVTAPCDLVLAAALLEAHRG